MMPQNRRGRQAAEKVRQLERELGTLEAALVECADRLLMQAALFFESAAEAAQEAEDAALTRALDLFRAGDAPSRKLAAVRAISSHVSCTL